MSVPTDSSTIPDAAAAARSSFLAGDRWAYLAGIIAILLGAALVFFALPKPDEERRLLAEYRAGCGPPRRGDRRHDSARLSQVSKRTFEEQRP